jgi:pSer/pThr/pTyr-binding forkhead associated (FHA) protein
MAKKGKDVGSVYRLNADLTTLGRAKSNDIVLTDDSVSLDHAKIRREQEGYMLYDLVTANGTYVNEQKIVNSPLKENDQIRLGETVLVLKIVE